MSIEVQLDLDHNFTPIAGFQNVVQRGNMLEEKHIDNAAANGLHGSRVARRSCHEHNCSDLEIQPNPCANIYLSYETVKVTSVTGWASANLTIPRTLKQQLPPLGQPPRGRLWLLL
jgi:hypothetical protein